ncbi:MAG: hypothetical protein Q8P41_25780 [Pseudomonadota bacterium]|nr:hypothetical protein [Pseudomonadota bacterium]
MATTHQRRPDGKAPDGKAADARTLVEPKDRAALEAQLQKLDEQKRALEQRGEAEGLDAELAARLQPSMGNAAIAGLLNRATDTTSAQEGDLALDELKDEELEEEGEEKEAGEIEHVLPSFSTGGGGGGGGQPPWAMGRMLGGDDDDEVEAVEATAAGWRPMPVLPDPDEDDGELEAEAEAGGDPDEPDAIDLSEALEALGDATWRPSVLARGLRRPRLLARAGFDPEALVDASGLDHALGRARAMLRFVALHGDGLDAVLLARAATGAGEPVFPPAAGFAGATARALALLEVTLASLPPGWAALLDVLADPRARARVEQVAVTVAEAGGLSATALFEAVLGANVTPGEVDLVLGGHPAALLALTTAARLDPLPLVDLWARPVRPPRADPAADALDAVLARFTGAAAPDGPGIAAGDLSALFESMNLLLGAIGGALVEVAAAGVAVAPHAEIPAVAGILGEAERVLRRAARRLYKAGEALQRLVGTEDEEQVRAISAETLAVRSTADLARQSAVASLAALLLDTEPSPPELPDLYVRAEAEAAVGRGPSARGFLEAAIVSAPPELEGRVLLAAGGLLLKLGYPDSGQLAESAERLGDGVLGAGARSLSAGLSLARESWGAAEVDARAGLRIGMALGLPYVVADAACSRATALAMRGDDWRSALHEGAAWLRARDEGAALNLVKARWGELAST